MKTYFLALVFIIFAFLGTASAEDKLTLYAECSGEQDCIEITYDNGEKESVRANPLQVLTKDNIHSAFVRRSGGLDGIISLSLDILLDKEVSAKITEFMTEDFGKRIVAVFNNKIIDANIRARFDRTIISIRELSCALEKAPWLKDLVEESYNTKIGRSVYIYGSSPI